MKISLSLKNTKQKRPVALPSATALPASPLTAVKANATSRASKTGKKCLENNTATVAVDFEPMVIRPRIYGFLLQSAFLLYQKAELQ